MGWTLSLGCAEDAVRVVSESHSPECLFDRYGGGCWFFVLHPLIALVLAMTGQYVTPEMIAGMMFWAVILSAAALVGLAILLSKRAAKALGAAQDSSALAMIAEAGRGVKSRYCPMIRVED